MQRTIPSRRLLRLSLDILTVAACGLCLFSADLAAKGKPGDGGGSGGGGDITGPQFVLIDLGSFSGGGLPVVRRMNNMGGVLAHHDTGENGGPANLLELDETGVIQDIVTLTGPDAPDQGTYASDLNDDFNVVGSANRPYALDANRTVPFTQAILWRVPASGPLEIIELQGFPIAEGNVPSSTASAISENGLIVGIDSENDVVNEASVRRELVVWQTDATGVVSLIALSEGRDGTGISSSGIVTGVTDTDEPAYWVLQFDEQGILIGASDPILLPGLGGVAVWANDLSEGGRISGSADTADGQRHAVVWTVDATGTLTGVSDLGIPARYENASATSAADTGDTVGNAWRNAKGRNSVGQEWIPFIDYGSGPTDLNDQVVDMAGLKRLTRANHNNENGWICGVADSGTQLHGFVAIPLP